MKKWLEKAGSRLAECDRNGWFDATIKEWQIKLFLAFVILGVIAAVTVQWWLSHAIKFLF